MKVFDSISIGCGGYPGDAMSLDQLIQFVDNVRGHEGVLKENRENSDYRSVVYDFIKAEDLKDDPRLSAINPDTAWLLAERNKAYKRKADEGVQAWKDRISDLILSKGYIVRGNKPVLVAELEIDDSIPGFKATGSTLKIDRDSTVYTIYPCNQ